MPKLKTGKIGGAHVRAAWQGVATGGTRDYLNGVHVQARKGGGVLLTATDGHMLVRVFDAGGVWPFKPAILAFTPQALTALKRDPKRPGDTHVTFTGDADLLAEATLTPDKSARHTQARFSNGASLPVTVIDGSYPDADRVIPTQSKMKPRGVDIFAVQASLIARFEGVRREFDAGKIGAISLQSFDAGSPMLVHFEGVPAFGVVMPWGRTPESKLPAWRDHSVRVSPAEMAKAIAKLRDGAANDAPPVRAVAARAKAAPRVVDSSGMNAAQKAWATRRANGWKPTPRAPAPPAPVAEVAAAQRKAGKAANDLRSDRSPAAKKVARVMKKAKAKTAPRAPKKRR